MYDESKAVPQRPFHTRRSMIPYTQKHDSNKAAAMQYSKNKLL